MKLRYLLIPVLFITGCANTPSENLNSEDISISTSNPSIEESSSEIESSSDIESSTNEENSSEIESSEAHENKPTVDVSDKEYYKSLVNRDEIKYSEPLVNDSNHIINALEIFEINDTHGAYYDEPNILGISRVATLIKEETVDPYSVIKVAGGDMLQGTAFSNMLLGEPGIAALNEMHFDAFTLGNHEFDWGLDNLAVYKDGDLSNGELNCPFLGANVVDGNGNRPDWVEPYTIVEKGNVKVGIIGVMGDNLETSISKVALGDYHFTSTTAAVNKYCKILKEEKMVDIVIVSSHGHSEAANESYVRESKVDAILNGHDHRKVVETVTRYDGKIIPVIEAQTKNINVGKITLNLDSNKNMVDFEMRHFDPKLYIQDLNMKDIMNTYFKVTEGYQNEVIGYNKGGLSKKELGISTMTYIAKKYDVDLAITNQGGVRANIRTDDITNGLIYEAMPFDNELYIATVSGVELKRLASGSGNYYNDSGIGNGVNCNLSMIKGDQIYKVIAVDYIATKPFYAQYFNEEHDLIKTGDYIRDCAIENIKENYKK